MSGERSPVIEADDLVHAAQMIITQPGVTFVPADEIFMNHNNEVVEKETERLFIGSNLCGRFEVTRSIQSGCFGRGWACKDLRDPLQRQVFVKTFRSHSDKYAKGYSIGHETAVRKEVEYILKQQAMVPPHENVVAMLCCYGKVIVPSTGRSGNLFFQLSPLCEGGELFDFVVVKGKPCVFSEKTARFIFRGLAQGVAHLHGVGVFHRDLKLENVLLDSQYNAKIIDFGSAKMAQDCEIVEEIDGAHFATNTQWCGTRAYQPIELLRNSGSYNPAAFDVWSTGVILFFLIAIDVLCKKKQGFALFSNIGTRKINLLDNIRGPDNVPHNRKLWVFLGPALKISNTLKHMFNAIFDADPKTRWSIDQIQAHPWFAEPDPTMEEILGDMRQRDIASTRDVVVDISEACLSGDDAMVGIVEIINQFIDSEEVAVSTADNKVYFGPHQQPLYEVTVTATNVSIHWIAGSFEQWLQFTFDLQRDVNHWLG